MSTIKIFLIGFMIVFSAEIFNSDSFNLNDDFSRVKEMNLDDKFDTATSSEKIKKEITGAKDLIVNKLKLTTSNPIELETIKEPFSLIPDVSPSKESTSNNSSSSSEYLDLLKSSLSSSGKFISEKTVTVYHSTAFGLNKAYNYGSARLKVAVNCSWNGSKNITNGATIGGKYASNQTAKAIVCLKNSIANHLPSRRIFFIEKILPSGKIKKVFIGYDKMMNFYHIQYERVKSKLRDAVEKKKKLHEKWNLLSNEKKYEMTLCTTASMISFITIFRVLSAMNKKVSDKQIVKEYISKVNYSDSILKEKKLEVAYKLLKKKGLSNIIWYNENQIQINNDFIVEMIDGQDYLTITALN